MEKQRDEPIPSVSEPVREPGWGCQDVVGMAGDSEGDHGEWERDRRTKSRLISRTEPEQEWGATGLADGQRGEDQAVGTERRKPDGRWAPGRSRKAKRRTGG